MRTLLMLAALALPAPAFGGAAALRGAQPPEALLAARPRLDATVSIEDAIAVALRESPVVRGAAREVEAAAAHVVAARAERRPWLSLNSFLSGGSAPNIFEGAEPVQPRMTMGLPRDRFFDQNLNFMVPLYTGGRLEAMVRRARAVRDASAAELEETRQEVALTVRLAYREAQARRSFLGVYQAALEQNRERQRIDQIAFEQDRIPRFYVLRNAAEVANAEQMLTYARRDLEISLLQLKTAMGVHIDSQLDVTPVEVPRPAGEWLAALQGDQGTDLPRLLAAAVRNRPELLAAERRVAAGIQETRVARSAYRPQVVAGVMGDLTLARGMDPHSGTTFALAASLPILDGGARRARLRAAEAEVRKREEERTQTALAVAQEVATALVSLQAAERNVATARAAVAAAEEDYRVAQLRYTAGRGINVEALDALAAQVRAQNNEVQALYEYGAAQDRLLRAVGLLRAPGAR
jgi:outer membrane protein TolC